MIVYLLGVCIEAGLQASCNNSCRGIYTNCTLQFVRLRLPHVSKWGLFMRKMLSSVKSSFQLETWTGEARV